MRGKVGEERGEREVTVTNWGVELGFNKKMLSCCNHSDIERGEERRDWGCVREDVRRDF